MAQQTYRTNLSSAVFPMAVAKSGKSVIIPGPDQNFDRRIDSPGDTPRGSVSIPQVIYGENILPTPDGYQSIGYIADTDITIPNGELITVVTPVRIATQITTTTTSETTAAQVLYTDAGDKLEVWTKSPNEFYYNGADAQGAKQVEENAGAGNPANSYRFITTTNDQGAGFIAGTSLYLHQAFTFGDPDNLELNFEFEFASFQELEMLVGIGNDSAGSGLKIWINNDTGVEVLEIGTASTWVDFAGFSSYVSTAITTPLSAGTLYKLQVTAARTSGDIRLITANLKDAGGSTLFTANTTQTFIPGPDIGFGFDNPAAIPNSWESWIDNIEITGDGTTTVISTDHTETTGIETAYISFFSDDTAKWSLDLDSWDNFDVTVPGSFASPAAPANISVATVRGTTYICIRDTLAGTTQFYTLTIDIGTNVITFVDISTTIAGALPNTFTINSIISICGSYNYLVLASGGAIIWSSTTTPTDFAPSLVSGAGNEVPGNLKGDISFLREHISGFFIYSAKNVVFAAYTGNARYPWRFREVGGSGGFNYSTQVSGDTNSAVQYGLNNTKLIQILNPETAELVAPEVTDFVERAKQFDNFDATTFTFSLSDPAYPLIPIEKPTTWFVLDRYLLLPFGLTENTLRQWNYVIVYDSLLKRYGKLKLLFDFCLSDEEKIYFIDRSTGTVNELYFDINVQDVRSAHVGVIVLGKFQYVRSRFLTIELIDIETIQNTTQVPLVDRNFDARVLPTLDGKTFETAVTPYDATAITTLNMYNGMCHVSCHNFALALKGAFDLNTIELVFHVDGDL